MPIVRFMTNNACLHLFAVVCTCSSQLSLLSIMTPRYLTDSDSGITVLHILILVGCNSVDLVHNRTYVLSSLILRSLSSHHLIMHLTLIVVCSKIVDISSPWLVD